MCEDIQVEQNNLELKMNYANFDIDSLHGDEPYFADDKSTAESIEEANERMQEQRDEMRGERHAITR